MNVARWQGPPCKNMRAVGNVWRVMSTPYDSCVTSCVSEKDVKRFDDVPFALTALAREINEAARQYHNDLHQYTDDPSRASGQGLEMDRTAHPHWPTKTMIVVINFRYVHIMFSPTRMWLADNGLRN